MNKVGVVNITLIAFEDVKPDKMDEQETKIKKALKDVTLFTSRRCVKDSFNLFDIDGINDIPIGVKDHIIICNEGSKVTEDESFVEVCKSLNKTYKNATGEDNPEFGTGAALCVNNILGFIHMKRNGLRDMIKEMVESNSRVVYNINIVTNPTVVKAFMDYRDSTLVAVLAKYGFGGPSDISSMDKDEADFVTRKVNQAILKFPTHSFLSTALDEIIEKYDDLELKVYTHTFLTTTDKVSAEDLESAEYLDQECDEDWDEEPCDIFGVDEEDFDAPPYKYLN